MFSLDIYDKALVDNLKRFKKDSLSDEKYITSLVSDIESNIAKYQIDSEEYFLYNFETATTDIKQTYVSTKEYKECIVNSIQKEYLDTYKNKYSCYLAFKDYFKRDVIKVQDFNDYAAFKDFVDKHKKYIIKVIDGSLGSKVSVVNVNPNDDVKNLFFFALSYGGCIIEEFVNQDPVFAKFNESSVNTIRLTTVYDGDDVEFLFSLARFGRDNEIVDNGGQGGIISMVNPLTGEVISDGYTEDVEKFEKHPNSKIAIKGFKIPQWNDLINTATEIVKKTKGITIIGWDFALTDKGWVIIEANTCPSIFPIQMLMTQTFGHGIRSEYEKTIGKYKNCVRTDY